MLRGLLGGLATLMLVAAGVFWWQGRAETTFGDAPVLAIEDAPDAEPDDLPSADVDGLVGVAPPEATEAGRETKRFNMLDKDGNNLLTFEEWAHTTVDKFKFADGNADLWLSREEFAATRPKTKPKPKCSCK